MCYGEYYILLNSTSEKIIKNCIKVLKKQKYSKNKLKIKGNFRELRALTEKEVSIDIDAYLTLHQKPSRLRVWLKASYTDTDGTKRNQVTSKFIEEKNVLYGDDLSGLVNSTEKLKIKIPKIDRWLILQRDLL